MPSGISVAPVLWTMKRMVKTDCRFLVSYGTSYPSFGVTKLALTLYVTLSTTVVTSEEPEHPEYTCPHKLYMHTCEAFHDQLFVSTFETYCGGQRYSHAPLGSIQLYLAYTILRDLSKPITRARMQSIHILPCPRR